MDTNSYGLIDSDVVVLNTIIDKINGMIDLEIQMDYVDGLVLWSEFTGEYSDDVLDEIDSDLRDYVV